MAAYWAVGCSSVGVEGSEVSGRRAGSDDLLGELVDIVAAEEGERSERLGWLAGR